MIGLILASFAIRGACWIETVKMLTSMDPESRQ